MNKLSGSKDVRWRQRFDNFERAFQLLHKYANKNIPNELERAGLIQFFGMSFDLSWKLMKDYLEAEGFIVKSPRDVIKQAFQIELIEDGHLWIEALSKRNLTAHTYDNELAQKFVQKIIQDYTPMLQKLYGTLLEEK